MHLRKLNVANCGTSFSFGIQRHTTMMWIPGMTIKLVYLPHAYFIYPCYCYHPAGVISYLTRLHCIFAVNICTIVFLSSQTDWLSKRYQNVSIKEIHFSITNGSNCMTEVLVMWSGRITNVWSMSQSYIFRIILSLLERRWLWVFDIFNCGYSRELTGYSNFGDQSACWYN